MSSWGKVDVIELWKKWGGNSQDVDWGGLEDLVELWMLFGKGTNLVGPVQLGLLWRHVAEGLMAARVVEKCGLRSGRRLDVGSGGGLPALVMALALTGPGILVEPREKRSDFLLLAQRKLDVERVIVRRGRICAGRFEALDGAGPLDRQFEVVGARAVFEPMAWLEVAQNWIGDDGIVLVHTSLEFEVPRNWTVVESLRWQDWVVWGLSTGECST